MREPRNMSQCLDEAESVLNLKYDEWDGDCLTKIATAFYIGDRIEWLALAAKH